MSVIPGHGAAGDAVAKAMAALDKPTAVTDAPAAPVTEAPRPPEDHNSRAFQVLAKKEKQMLMRAREFKEREQRMAEREAIIKRHEDLESQGRQNPMAILQALGWDYDKLTQYHLSGGSLTPEMIAQEAIRRADDLEKKMSERDERQTQEEIARAKAQQQELEDGFKEEVNDVLASSPDDFEYINHFGMQDLVYDTIKENFAKNKKIMDIKEAAKLVEQFLEEEEVEKLTKVKKFQKRTAPQEQLSTDQSKVEGVRTGPSPSLNNRQAVSTTSTTLPARTEQDRIQRALAALDRK